MAIIDPHFRIFTEGRRKLFHRATRDLDLEAGICTQVPGLQIFLVVSRDSQF